MAIATAVAVAPTVAGGEGLRIDVRSIGTATPAEIASVATGLGVPVTRVIEAVYQAPCVLVDGLTPELGSRMAELLEELGCRVSVEARDAPAPPSQRLFDVALYVREPGRYSEIVQALAAFLGCDANQAGRLVLQSPGVVLGKVSEATAIALAERLGEGAELIVSDPASARYDLFLGDCEAVVRRRVLDDLRRKGREPLASGSCLLTGLERAEAEELWTMVGRVPAVRIVNEDFLRFDIVLTRGSPTAEARALLTEYAGIPERVLARVFESLPVTVIEAVPNDRMPEALERLSRAGLGARADMVTFLHLGLELRSVDPRVRVEEVLDRLGLEAEGEISVPGRLPFVMPELQARLVRDALAGAGIQVDLFEPGE